VEEAGRSKYRGVVLQTKGSCTCEFWFQKDDKDGQKASHRSVATGQMVPIDSEYVRGSGDWISARFLAK
jgi:hypothetical protein